MAQYLRVPPSNLASAVLVLTAAEAKALAMLASEGAEGLLNDAAAARAYLGGPPAVQAAQRALAALQSAAAAANGKG